MTRLEREQDAAFEAFTRKAKETGYWLAGGIDGDLNGGFVDKVAFNIKQRGSAWFIVTKATIGDKQVVAFTECDTIAAGFHNIMVAIRADKMKWRKDKPWTG